jgi:hypothetical protein
LADRAVTGINLQKRRKGHGCPRSDKTVTGSNIQKRKRHQNVHWQIGLLLGATFKRGKDTEMSKGGEDCHWKQYSKEEKTPKCPLADRAVVGSNVQKRKGHRNVQRQIRLSLGATFKRGKDTEMSKGGYGCH